MEDITNFEKVAVIANAPIKNCKQMKRILEQYDLFIAVDGGLRHCIALGVAPVFLIGDMDSVNPIDKERFPTLREVKLDQDKDDTDLEAALSFIIKKHPKSITIFGGLGGRIDHTLTNLILLTRYQPKKIFFETETEILGIVNKTLKFNTEPGQTLSLIPMNGAVHGITTDGLKWEIKRETLDKNFIGISNKAIGNEVVINVSEGDLLYSITKTCTSTD